MRRPHRVLSGLALASLALLAAACSGPAPGLGGVPGLRVSSQVVGIDGSIVQVEAAHQSYNHRIEEIALVGPDGQHYTSKDTTTESVIDSGYGGRGVGVGVGGGGGSHGGFAGVGIGLDMGSLGGNRPVFRTTARIPIPDKAAYRKAPQDWQIAITVGQKGGPSQVITQPAPTQ
jgi:hypothetical protein